MVLVPAAYVGLLVVSASLAYSLATSPWKVPTSQWKAWGVILVAFTLGSFLTVLIVPDWSPLSISLAFAPFWLMTVWTLVFVFFSMRGRSRSAATRRSAVWAFLLLVLTPVGAAAGTSIGIVLVLLGAVVIASRGRLPRDVG